MEEDDENHIQIIKLLEKINEEYTNKIDLMCPRENLQDENEILKSWISELKEMLYAFAKDLTDLKKLMDQKCQTLSKHLEENKIKFKKLKWNTDAIIKIDLDSGDGLLKKNGDFLFSKRILCALSRVEETFVNCVLTKETTEKLGVLLEDILESLEKPPIDDGTVKLIKEKYSNIRCQVKNNNYPEDVSVAVKNLETEISRIIMKMTELTKNEDENVNQIYSVESNFLMAKTSLEKSTAEIAVKNIDIENLNIKIRGLQNNLEIALAEINTLKITNAENIKFRTALDALKIETSQFLLNHQSSTDESIGSSFTDLDAISLSSLVNALKCEISAKDEVLKNKKESIDQLETNLSECRRQLSRFDEENQTLNRTVQLLSDEKQKLEIYASEKSRTVDTLQSKLGSEKMEHEKLKDECNNQQQTIAHLRHVLEETKRNGNASINHTKELNDVLNFNIKNLSEQVNEFYEENITKERQIQVLRDANLQLREQICELQKDIADYKELVEIKNLNNQFNYCKENEIDNFKAKLRELNEENLRLKEILEGRMHHQNNKIDEREKQCNTEVQDIQDKMRQLLTLTQESAQTQFNHQHYQVLLQEVTEHQVSINEWKEKNQELHIVLRDYKNKHKELETHIGTLSYENSNLLHEIERVKVELKEKSTESSRLQIENHKLIGELKAQQEACRCMSTKRLPKVHLSLQLQIQNLRRENQEKDIDIKKLRHRIRESRDEFEKLSRNTLIERERMQQETKDLIDVVGKQKSQLMGMRTELECKENELIRANETTNLVLRQCQENEKKHIDWEKRYSTLTMKEQSVKHQLEELRKQMLTQKQTHTAQESRTLQELSCARQAIRDQQVRIVSQEDTFKCLNEVKRELENRFESIFCENKKLRDQIKAESQTKSALLELVSVLENEQQSLKDKICTLMNTDQDLNKAINTLEHLKIHTEELTCKYEKLYHDHTKLFQEHHVLLQLRDQSIKALKSSELVQGESEEKVQVLRCKIDELVESIQILLKERETLIQLVDQKHRDVIVLSSRIQSNCKSQIPFEYLTPFHAPFVPNQLQELQLEPSEEQDVLNKLLQMKSALSHTSAIYNGVLETISSQVQDTDKS